ncbi:MAG TPA: xanthine dehydrogenase family protein molybdopterin-binding subunit [Anaeromyxobacteraceae bacterium]|nr:xanthine dehydrogenase family protein molybdopterin-binding subunit [Anaeromyxobacteraceae bacterium]
MSAVSRRDFLRTSLASGAGLVIAFHVPLRARAAPAEPQRPLPAPNAFLRIAPDGAVTILLAHSEMGQGVWTGLAMLVAEELRCDWSKVRVEHAPAAPAYFHTAFGMQMTGGSTTTWSEFDRYRTVGAMARDMLVRAAAARWKADPRSLFARDGHVHDGSRRKLSYGDLAAEAERLEPPARVALSRPADWRLIGKRVRRLDTPEKITGKATFGIDVRFPGLRAAVVARPPVFGATVKSFDAAGATAVPGVEKVVQVPSGVAVVARDTWAALRGREALRVEWDLGPGSAVDSAKLLAAYRELARTPGAIALEKGDADAALAGAARKVEAEFDVPYLAHAPMEPLNCAVKIDGDRCQVWTGTQFQTVEQATAARIAGVPPENVTVHTAFLGGGFGRRANPRADFVSEAVQVAKAAGVPVKVTWTREDDIRGGFYRPLFVHRVEVGVDRRGWPVAWRHTVVGQSILAGTPFEAMVKNGIDEASVEGVVDSPYLAGVPARRVMLHSPRNEVPVLWWRSVGNTHTAFVMESAIDELAHGAGRDPLAFREALLARHPRHLRVLRLAAEKAGWDRRPPAGRARGLAVHESFGSIVAEVAEVSVEKGRIRVHRVTCAVDCGLAVNPLAVEAQVEGSVAFGLGPTLKSALTLQEGKVKESNFHDYEVLRLDEMPEVAVHLVRSGAKMGGVGEPATAPVAPAVANAVFALTGRRLRSLPLRLG